MSGSIPSLEISGVLATLRLQRPDKANRLEEADLTALLECLARIEAAPQVRVVLLRASGRHFCAGYSFDDLAAAGDGGRFEAVADALENLRPLTIAEVQGGVFGGATDILLACDFRLGGPAAQMLMPAARFGLHLYPGLFERYVSRLGLNAAKRLILACEKLDAQGMLETGLLTHLYDSPERLAEASEALAANLAELAPLAVAGMKRHLNAVARGALDPAAVEEDVRRCSASADFQEGLRALGEKRPPRFEGR
ncbi:enoyl-CoA hydratase/isomerase family protein [Azotobacter chroococcum]|uniref:enoyl-CoA hydratase/isomerase family protein n=1 Tax=Azotobacter chroococcum TaxID=353 RepID=UPI00103F05CB|nr:enoyl-CoA hydratase/isomerase family protein [Azotobacter chroococcum]TBW08794.1 enoyl-CoA hydratase/isomerase family protein [Azotobacter chroococcum]